MNKVRLKGKKPDQYLIFDDGGYLAVCSGNLEDEMVEGKDKLIEILEEMAEDHPDDINKYRVFKLESVGFKAQVLEVSVTLDC